MQRFDHRPIRVVVAASLASVAAACSTDSFSNVNLIPRADFARADWLSFSGNKEEFTLRPVRPEDLVGPQGQCAGAGPEPGLASAGAPTEPLVPGPASIQGGIALQMTECDVVRRAGAPEAIEFGSNERGERTLVLTYIRSSRPGVYRFASGRLYSIERAVEPSGSAKPAPAKAAKKPARG
jgi:hypothetical protein